MNDHDLKKIDEMFQHHIGILIENLQHKSQKIDALVDAFVKSQNSPFSGL